MAGAERVAAAFERARADRRAALVPYFVAGYPDLSTSLRLLRKAADEGADVIELGIPFSDPVADGPTIQAAVTQALQGGVRPADALNLVRTLRRDGVHVPILAMTYANVLYPQGWAHAARALKSAGVDGAIVPDVPLEESAEYRRVFARHGLGTVLLATPSTSDERLSRIARATRGFLYLVAVHGTTGARRRVAPETRRLLSRVARLDVEVPVCVGFGVSTRDHVVTLKRAGADGVVVGSALVERIRRGGDVGSFLASLRRGL